MSRQAVSGTRNGYTDPTGRGVVVRDDVDHAQAVKTLIHEAAHVVLHSDLELDQYVEHRGIWETEAESVAYVAAGLAGLHTSAYRVGYVATWSAGGVEILRNTRRARALRRAHPRRSARQRSARRRVHRPARRGPGGR